MKAMDQNRNELTNMFCEKIKDRSRNRLVANHFAVGLSRLQLVACSWTTYGWATSVALLAVGPARLRLTQVTLLTLQKVNDLFCETLIQHGDQLTHFLQKQLVDKLGDAYKMCERDSTPLFKKNMKKIIVPEYLSKP